MNSLFIVFIISPSLSLYLIFYIFLNFYALSAVRAFLICVRSVEQESRKIDEASNSRARCGESPCYFFSDFSPIFSRLVNNNRAECLWRSKTRSSRLNIEIRKTQFCAVCLSISSEELSRVCSVFTYTPYARCSVVVKVFFSFSA